MYTLRNDLAFALSLWFGWRGPADGVANSPIDRHAPKNIEIITVVQIYIVKMRIVYFFSH